MSAVWQGLQRILGAILSFFYSLIPNFGIAVILLTIVIGVILFPLTLKQTRSMKAMQEIQPELKRLQRDLKHDRQAQQAAMMELYKERGVNPAAGCLPLILQMPVWFALFSVLRAFASSDLATAIKYVTSGSALETAVTRAVNGAGTLDFLWMDMRVSPSKSIAEQGFVRAMPYLITIVVVMITAYWQQKQTMAKTQPNAQPQPGQAVMKIFPFFFGFISFNLPAGLVVYFAASQLFRIGQQAMILGLDTRRKEKAPSRPKAPPPKEQAETPTAKSNPAGASQPPAATRRPQGSKKKRGKKRRRK
jgi:YidC/Oxa1 family membrane protein insertase